MTPNDFIEAEIILCLGIFSLDGWCIDIGWTLSVCSPFELRLSSPREIRSDEERHLELPLRMLSGEVCGASTRALFSPNLHRSVHSIQRVIYGVSERLLG